MGGQIGATTGPHHKSFASDLFREGLQPVVRDVNINVRLEEEDINAVELHSVDLGLGCQVEHCVEVNAWLGSGAAFAHKAGPHGIVQLRKIIWRWLIHGGND